MDKKGKGLSERLKQAECLTETEGHGIMKHRNVRMRNRKMLDISVLCVRS